MLAYLPLSVSLAKLTLLAATTVLVAAAAAAQTHGSKNISQTQTLLTLLVGPHKTGTTSIQHLLYFELRKLLFRDGIGVPIFESKHQIELVMEHEEEYRAGLARVPGTLVKNAASLAKDIEGGNFNSSRVVQLIEVVKQKSFSEVVVGAEGFAKGKPNFNFDFLRNNFMPHMRIVVSRRDIPEWIQSCYRWHPTNLTFAEFIQGSYFHPYASLNPHHVSYAYESQGFNVEYFDFMDTQSLFCRVIRSPRACAALMQNLEIPHENAKPSLSPACAGKSDIERLEKVFVHTYHVPQGLYDWSTLICADGAE